MTEVMNKRLEELRGEYSAGQRMIADLHSREADLRSSMLRISGAIQVLEELLASDATPNVATPVAAIPDAAIM